MIYGIGAAWIVLACFFAGRNLMRRPYRRITEIELTANRTDTPHRRR